MPAPSVARASAVRQPYPGLRAFDLPDAFLFFGRDEHTQELLDRLARNRFLAVIGTSGSGKSSLVRAGLIPALFRGYLNGASSRWRVAVMRPGSDPLCELASALAAKQVFHTATPGVLAQISQSTLGLTTFVRGAGLAEGESLLIVVDQFEELFRFASEARDHDIRGDSLLFIRSLLEAVDQFEVPIYVVLTMRTDFLGDCTRFPGLPQALNNSQYLIPRLSREQRRDAIEQPIEIAGREIAPRLVQQILNDMGDDPDQLPVMQHALARMFRLAGAGDAPLDLDDYRRAGTVASALNDHAQAIFEALPADRRSWACRIFRCLTATEDGREVRRPARIARIFEVTGAADDASREAVREVIDAFSGDQNSLLLVSRSDDPDHRIVDISHESLIRQWHQLRRWVKEEAESAEWFCDLQRTALRQAGGQGSYWANPELARVLTCRARDGWNAAWAMQYGATAASYAQVEAFVEGSQRVERRKRMYRYLILLGAVVLVIALLVALDQFRHAKNAETELARLTVERQQDHAQLASLEQIRNSAKTPDEQRQVQSKIDAITRKIIDSLQQENQALNGKLAEARQQAQTAPVLAQQIESLNHQVSDLTPKAQQAEELRQKTEELRKRVRELEPVKQERDQLLARLGTPVVHTPEPAANAVAPAGPGTGKAAAVEVDLTNDSAASAGDTGLLLMVKHMGIAPQSADLYVFSGEAFHPYRASRSENDKQFARFQMKTCDGGHTAKDGFEVWCFRLQANRIRPRRGERQLLGPVTARGRRYELWGTAFNAPLRGDPSVGIEVVPVK